MLAGDTLNIPVVLLEMTVVPQLPSKSSQFAPRPSEPPLTVKVVEAPEHIVDGEAETDVGATEMLFIDTAVLTQLVVLHVPEPCT